MFDLFFSFSGRIGRLQYFLRAIGSVVILIATAALSLVSIPWRDSPIAGLLAMLVVMVVLVIGSLWSSLSLQARRFRDIGWDPVLVMPCYFVLCILVGLAARRMGQYGAVLSGSLTLSHAGVLLFWAGKEAPPLDLDAIFGGEAEPPRRATAPAAPPPSRERTAARTAGAEGVPHVPARSRAPTKTFGRRGLA